MGLHFSMSRTDERDQEEWLDNRDGTTNSIECCFDLYFRRQT